MNDLEPAAPSDTGRDNPDAPDPGGAGRRPARRRRATDGSIASAAQQEGPGSAGAIPATHPPGPVRRVVAEAVADARAEQLAVEFGAIGRADAREVRVDKGAVGLARAERVSVRMGSLGGAFARDVEVQQGFARTVVAGSVQLERGGVRSIVANRVTLGPQSLAGIVVARTVDGPGRILLDWRGALVLAGAIVLVRLLGPRRPRIRRAGG
jgi:hypothetical protein